jgi:hypothetical protein
MGLLSRLRLRRLDLDATRFRDASTIGSAAAELAVLGGKM